MPPGSVTPFSVINDRGARVRVVLDEGMLALDPLNFHPVAQRPHDGNFAG